MPSSKNLSLSKRQARDHWENNQLEILRAELRQWAEAGHYDNHPEFRDGIERGRGNPKLELTLLALETESQPLRFACWKTLGELTIKKPGNAGEGSDRGPIVVNVVSYTREDKKVETIEVDGEKATITTSTQERGDADLSDMSKAVALLPQAGKGS